ncbi:hypothetical protein SERLA73DRAFT_80175 [Serpula lacrymans var. lacrymans S7.3]|uniref:Chromo domain-containing protein n=1 Tax=Serpula lacrymans var. lacrymans (strain S7.3) TaxID=936435 RepID=F8QIY3_SERL3|nr:hypothetical protein SERLA73DRAFT_80175 [Serpula lacrymans var. lacrymans S7.3]
MASTQNSESIAGNNTHPGILFPNFKEMGEMVIEYHHIKKMTNNQLVVLVKWFDLKAEKENKASYIKCLTDFSADKAQWDI